MIIWINNVLMFDRICRASKVQPLSNNKDRVSILVLWYIVVYVHMVHIGETIRNFDIGWKEDNAMKDKNSHCRKHQKNSFNHEFWWFVLSCLSKNSLNLSHWRCIALRHLINLYLILK